MTASQNLRRIRFSGRLLHGLCIKAVAFGTRARREQRRRSEDWRVRLADRNERRNITKGQKAMAYAIINPTGTRGRGNKEKAKSLGLFSDELLRQAPRGLISRPRRAKQLKAALAAKSWLMASVKASSLKPAPSCDGHAHERPVIIDAMNDSDIGFGRWFSGESWSAWRVILKAAFALPMTDGELVTFRELAGGRDPPARRVRELWIAAGLQGRGKTASASLLATYAATIEEAHVGRLRPRGACDSSECLAMRSGSRRRSCLGYIKAFFEAMPDLRAR